jgi:hypothetical protein
MSAQTVANPINTTAVHWGDPMGRINMTGMRANLGLYAQDVVVISCFNQNANPADPPAQMTVALNLISPQFVTPGWKLQLLLHGASLFYALQSQFDPTPANPLMAQLEQVNAAGVQILVCNFCFDQDGYNISECLPFINPVPYAPQYMIQQQLAGNAVLFDE